MKSILDEAQNLVYGFREKAYGSPLEDFTKVAALWSIVLGVKVKPKDIPLCMIMLKVSREMHLHGNDNLVDIVGYAGTLEKVWKEMEENLSDGAGEYRHDLTAKEMDSASVVVPAMTGEKKKYWGLYECAKMKCENKVSIEIKSDYEISLNEYPYCIKCGSNAWLPILGDNTCKDVGIG